MKTLKLYLHRTRVGPLATDGTIYDEQGHRMCDSAEATLHMLPPGQHAIGRFADHFSRTNGVYALKDATILVGSYLCPGVVIHTAVAFRRLEEHIWNARVWDKRKVVLVVTEAEGCRAESTNEAAEN